MGRRWITLFLVTIGLSVSLAACLGGGRSNGTVDITLVSFAVTRTAHEAIIPKFAAKWQQEHGQKVHFRRSYGGSGAQTRAVIDGLGADVVHLALAVDTRKIAQAGLITTDWTKKLPHESNVSRSVAVLIARPGNPKGIKTWADLTKDGVKVITANPKTSGVARWNFLALWNSALATGNEATARQFVQKVFRNVVIMPRDAREAADVFLKQGQGDVLINYENEAILAQQKGATFDYIVPDVNISIDNPIAIVDKNVDKHGNRAVVEAFVQYLFTPEAQAEFIKRGFRPSDLTQASPYPVVQRLNTVKNLGGWPTLQRKLFADGAIFDQIQSQ